MSLQNLVQDQSCGQMNPLANLGNQMNAMGNTISDARSGFVQSRPDFAKVRPGMVNPMDQARVDEFTQSFNHGPGMAGPEMFRPPPMVQQQRPPGPMGSEFSRLQIGQPQSQGNQWANEFQQQAGRIAQTQQAQNWAQEFQHAQTHQAQNMRPMMRPQMMGPQMMGPQMMGPQMMGPQMMAPQMMAPQMMAPQMMAPQMMAPQMSQQAPPRQVREQKKQNVEVIEPQEAKPQEAGGGFGMSQEMLQNLANSDDPKWRNSKFLKFVTQISTGEIELKDDKVIRHAPEKEAELDLTQAMENMDWKEQFEQQYKDMALRGLPAPYQDNNTYTFAQENKFTTNEDPFSQGLQLFKEGKLKESIFAFEAALQKDPDNAEAWRYIGAAHAENENERHAIAALLKCIEVDPYNLPALLMLGVSYTNDLEEKRALNYLKTWMFNHPDYQDHISGARQDVQEYEEYYANPGNSLDTGLHEQVTKMFLEAIKINPQDADLHQVLGVLYHLSNDYDNAVQSFRAAVKLRPDDASLWNKLGATQANSNNSGNAVEAYKRALQLRPTYVRALSNLAIAFANQGLHEDAVRTYLATLKQNPDASQVWTYLSIALSQLGKPELMELVKKKNVELFRPHFQF